MTHPFFLPFTGTHTMMFSKPRRSHRASSVRLIAVGLALVLSLAMVAPMSVSAQTASNGAAASSPAANPAATKELPIIKPAGTEANANPYGMRSVWAQGDLVAKTTLITLAIMSLLSWYVIVAKVLSQRRMGQQAKAAHLAFSGADSLRKGADSLAKDSPFRQIVDSSLQSMGKHESLASQVDMNTWLSQDIVRNVGALTVRSQDGLAVLATVGATAPFVGLFGTVWGIYNALVTIGISGQASIDRVAGPVGEALIMTALGLAVAVPAVLGYNWLVRRNKLALHTVKSFGSDLHTLLLVEVDKSLRTPAGKNTAG